MADQGAPAPTDSPSSAAPAAPEGGAAPAAAPVAPAAPQGTQGAIDAARQRLAQGQRVVPEGESPEPPVEGEGGEPPAGEEGAEPAAEGAPTDAAGEEAPPEGEQAPDGEETKEFTVTLQGMDERGETPIELEAPDQETYDRLNRLQNEATLGREVKQHQRAVGRQRQELAEVEDMIAIDPTGFVLERVPQAVRTDVAMQLLFDDTVLTAVQERLRESGAENGLADVLESPEALRTLRAELKSSRLELRDELRGQTEKRKAMQANAERVAAEIDRLIPETVTGEQRELLFRDALRDVKERAQRLQLTQMEPEDVQLLVSERFRRQGIDLSALRSGPSAPASPAAKPNGRTGEHFKQAGKARRAAAATAPAGVGAPAVKPRPELPKTTAERIKLARKVGLRTLLGRS